MAKKIIKNEEETKMEGAVKTRKTKIDYIPEDMYEEFQAIQAALVEQKAKGSNRRDLTKMSAEDLQKARDKAAKRLAALEAALKG